MITKQPLKVLIAEDQESINKLIQHQLDKVGHTIIGKAINSHQAVELVNDLRPDVVLMEIEMPGLDGLEAARFIQEKYPCPVVLLTSHGDPEMVRRASQGGVGAYLMKPPSIQEIERTMIMAVARFADLIELHRVNKEMQMALENVKVLSGLLPICANCKKVRNDKGYWELLRHISRNIAMYNFLTAFVPIVLINITRSLNPEIEKCGDLICHSSVDKGFSQAIV